MHNPLRSEADVFRLVVVIGFAWRVMRGSEPRNVESPSAPDDTRRILVGDPDPNMAIEDALRVFPADEIIISTLPPEQSRWLEHEVVERTRREVELPMTHVIVDLDAERAATPLRSVG
jgi:hypothetical protein